MPIPEIFEWATDPAAALTEPPAAVQGLGFIPKTPLSAAYLNWLLQQGAAAARYVTGWSDLADFIDEADTDQMGILIEDTDDAAVGGTAKSSLTFGSDIVGIATDGRRLFTANRSGGTIYQRGRDLAGTIVTYELAHSLGPTVYRIIRAGTKLLTLYSQGGTYYVDCHTVADSGTLIAAAWTYTSPAGVLNDIAATPDACFIAREAGYVVPIPLSTGVAGTSYNHGAAVRGVAAHRNAVYLAGASGTGSATMRRLTYALGALVDVTAGGVEGPWDLTSGPVMTAGGRLAADARSLVVAWTAAETIAATIELRAPVTGQVTASRVYAPVVGGFGGATVPTQVAIDDEAVFLVIDDSGGAVGCVCRFDRPDLSFRWRYLTGAGVGVEIYCVATDGSVVFCGTDTASSTNPIRRLYRGNRRRTLTRRAPSASWSPSVFVSFEEG